MLSRLVFGYLLLLLVSLLVNGLLIGQLDATLWSAEQRQTAAAIPAIGLFFAYLWGLLD